MTEPRWWSESDPVATGAVAFPTKKAATAYAERCRAELLEGAARWVIAGRTRHQRRRRLLAIKEDSRPAVQRLAERAWYDEIRRNKGVI